MANDLAQLWGLLSRKVLATVLVDHGAVFPLYDVLGDNSKWFAPKEANLWTAICQCYGEGALPTVEAVAARTSTDAGYVQVIANQFDEEDGRRVLYHADELKRLGMLADLRGIGRELSSVNEPEAVGAAVEYATTRLSGVLAAQTRRKGDAHSVGEAAWAALEGGKAQAIPTGLAWFDKIASGLWPGFNYWIVGAYKSGKTTLMRNLLLTAAGGGTPCDVFCAEGSREMFALDCQAMIATKLLAEQGLTRDKLRLSGLFLRRTWHNDRAALTAPEYTAIQEAREQWNTLNVRVWDAVDGIHNLVTLRHQIQMSKYEYGSLVHFLDYSQLFGDEGLSIYERQSRTALVTQKIAQQEKVALVILSQRNEDAVRGGGGYSPGVKGGGDAAAAADFLLLPLIDHDQPGIFHVTLKHSRHTSRGQGAHVIDRESGLLLDKWQTAQVRALGL